MAGAAGIAVANIYYNQPMLAIIEQDLPGPFTSAIPTATQLGYALGLFLLVPLGDVIERRRLIVAQFVLLAVALGLAAVAPNALSLLLASLAIGLLSTVAQQIVPFAAHLATPERRGAVVGTVMAGLLAGILLSRTVAGFVAANGGWRDMFWLAAPIALAAAGLMAVLLPHSAPDSKLPYRHLLRSIGHLWSEFPALRLAALTQAALFAAFSVFWTVLAFRLDQPAFGMGADIVGLFGLLGTVGILAAPLAGRFADKHGATGAVMLSAAVTLVSWIILGAWGSLIGLVVGVILLDFGVQGALVSNQHIVFALHPDARARLNTVLMGSMFLGGALGSAASMLVWNGGGWLAVSTLGIGFSAIATILQFKAGRRHAN
ncbi:MFS transporter [Caenibius sp. WL]|uniref:MFS transporter n=1 Tax=Caenibius sp. WL TaxID=2872646 RepID=UPI001E7C7208|nr:MFS transporter [Caenibius sp. WL]QZP07627.1 MFS transporter [Caenibius sp. WL]